MIRYDVDLIIANKTCSGIFMALTFSLLLLVILWVGVSAIAGLEVSYMAFSKEMGPVAQNKGKQQ